MSPTAEPTRILMDEHRVIEGVLTALESMAAGAAREGTLDAGDAADALDFLRNFADRFHHAKEESELFTLLEEKGMPAEGGPTGQMRHEHEFGRARVQAMSEALDRSDPPGFAQAAREYVEMLRAHIDKEDHCLFAMAGNVLGPDDLRDLEERFRRIEGEPTMREARERCLRTAERLGNKYGAATQATDPDRA